MKQAHWEWLVIALSIGLTVLLSIRNPLFEPPDELLHYRYVRHLLTERNLPVQAIDGEQSHSHHPPLYYALGALLVSAVDDDQTESSINPYWTSYKRDEVHQDNKNRYLPNEAHNWPWQGTALVVHLLRFYSVALFTGTLLLVRKIGRKLWPDNAAKRLMMLTFVAFNPMLIYISSAFNNDNLMILLGTAIILTSLQALGSAESASDNKAAFTIPLAILIGLLWGLAVLTKLNGIVLASVWGSVLLWLFFKRRQPAFAIGRGIIIVLTSTPLFAWWFLRNVRVYGDLLGMDVHCAVWGCRSDEQFNLPHFQGNLRYVWTNYWGRFGYGQINMPDFIYLLLAILTLFALIGGFIWLRRKQRLRGKWFVLAMATLMFLLAVLYYLVRVPVGANARYAFPVSAAIAALLTQLLFQLPKMRTIAPGLILAFGLLAIWSTAWFLPLTYAAPNIASAAQIEARVPQSDKICWEQAICLLGYSTQLDDDQVWFDGCWVAERAIDEDLVFFVHLLDYELNPLGARDSYTGRGHFLTSAWQVDEPFCDRFAIPIESDVTQNPVAQVEIGMYRPKNGGERVSAEFATGSAPDPLFLNPIRLTTDPIIMPHADAIPISAQFEEGVSLAYYRWQSAETQHTLFTYWSIDAVPHKNYTIFAHVLTGDDQLLTQADGLPLNGAFPMTLWQAGDLLVDQRTFTIADLNSVDRVQIGFYDSLSGQRLLRANGAAGDSAEIPPPTK